MEANEVRVGNLVYYHIEDSMDERKEWDEVSPIDYDDIKVLSKYEDNSEYRPIPLTQEWLLKFGFEKMKCINFKWKTEWIIQPSQTSWHIGVVLENYPETNPNCGCVSILQPKNMKIHGIPKDLCEKEDWTKEDEIRAKKHTETFEKWRQPIAYFIKDVHQLQNLYFALTGEELTIVEPEKKL